MFKTNPDTDKIMRSLLQKAVRRGNIDVVKRILIYLINKDDFDWVRKRLAVITFEECWPYGLNVTYDKDPETIIKHYLNITCSVKNKDAAGLGSFAYELSNGDRTLQNFLSQENFNHVKFVANAINNSDDFWKWALKETNDDFRKATLVNKALESSKKASWPWDKAFILAGAYLAVIENVPKIKYKKTEVELPYWVGIDKHTPLGKMAIKSVAEEKRINEDKALMLSFYCEGAILNNYTESFWWDSEVFWKLKKYNLTINEGNEIWNTMRYRVAQLLNDETLKTKQKIVSVNPDETFNNNQQQLGLF